MKIAVEPPWRAAPVRYAEALVPKPEHRARIGDQRFESGDGGAHLRVPATQRNPSIAAGGAFALDGLQLGEELGERTSRITKVLGWSARRGGGGVDRGASPMHRTGPCWVTGRDRRSMLRLRRSYGAASQQPLWSAGATMRLIGALSAPPACAFMGG